ncbi:MAG TPA: cyclic nucleotide-binding domain-containing protein [Gammaproteobacteria bacterium]|nr:cyclic nucleotide-binding domain-containing protein [Gammaproteobacteria bacterium]
MSEQAAYERVCASVLGAELDADECRVVAGVMGVRHLGDGEVLVSEGEEDTALYLLAEGKLGVISEIDGQNVQVYTMSEGECAGTRAFVDRSPRKATLKAVGNATVYVLQPAAFESLLDTHPRIVYRVMRALFRITHMNLMRMNLESQQLSNYITKSHGRY